MMVDALFLSLATVTWFRVCVPSLSCWFVNMFVQRRRFECLQKEFAKNNAQICPDRNLEQREPFWKKIGKREKSWSRFKTGPPAFAYGYQLPLSKKDTGFKASALNANSHFKKYRVQSARFECPTPIFEKILGSKRALWMPNSHVRNLKAPCHKESEPEKIVTQRGIWQQHTGCPIKGLKRVWNGFKIECPVPIYSTMSQKNWKQPGRRSREQPGSTQKERFKWNWNDFITPSSYPN